MAKVLTIKASECEIEIHMLNPGQSFEGFGGSRHALVPKKTASIVTRTRQHGVSDREMDIYDPNFWKWIGRLINGNGKEFKVEAIIETKVK
jgi:hypothetical protein